MSITSKLYEPACLRYQSAALTYTLVGYVAGWIGIFSTSWLVNVIATFVLGHSMIIAAYMIHECGHNLVFKSLKNNARLGKILIWFCGAAYGTYEDIRYKHFRHHVDVDDVVWFDYEAFFKKYPVALSITRFLEWFYIPAHDLIMHFIMVFTSFVVPQRRDQRLRNVTVIAARGTAYLTLLVFAPKAALLYAVAYILMMTVLRFMDSLQHDYEYSLTLFDFDKPPRKGEYEWEQEHTFSNPHTLRYSWPNWFTLNFGFHNAHHQDMKVPWYRLPDLHREMYGDDPTVVIPLGAQLKMFHNNRVSRVMGNHEGDEPWGREFLVAARKAEVSGGNAASFLTSF